MRILKRGQISIEYLMIVGFVMFLVISILGIALLYTASVKDELKFNQLERFAIKVISNAERVFFEGEPSQVTINAFLPSGVQSIYVDIDVPNDEYTLVFNLSSSSGESVIGFSSDVPMSLVSPGISTSEGLKRLEIKATTTEVTIEQV